MKEELVSNTPTKYGSSIEALRELLTSNSVTDISTNLSILTNGLDYSFVEVTCSDGVQYGLQAYGSEALELHKFAFEVQKIKEHVPPMMIVS